MTEQDQPNKSDSESSSEKRRWPSAEQFHQAFAEGRRRRGQERFGGVRIFPRNMWKRNFKIKS